MPDRGKIMSQTYYEKQSRLLKLYRESFERKEINAKETVTALMMIGFSETIAVNRTNEWDVQPGTQLPETEKDIKRRLKEISSLKNYLIRMRLGKKA